MPTLFQFGEKLPSYKVSILNERAIRAAAGILFFFAMVNDAQKQTEPVGSVSDDARRKAPEFAKAIGHEEKWKLHNNCL